MQPRGGDPGSPLCLSNDARIELSPIVENRLRE